MTPPARDGGHDIFLERGGMAWIVECKLYDRGYLQMLGERQMSRRRGSFRKTREFRSSFGPKCRHSYSP